MPNNIRVIIQNPWVHGLHLGIYLFCLTVNCKWVLVTLLSLLAL
jgi:hypothetical protein